MSTRLWLLLLCWLALPAAAQQVTLEPSAASRCLAPPEAQRGTPDYPFDAWKRGQFEEISVFTAPDPGGVPPTAQKREETARPSEVAPAAAPKETVSGDPNKSSIRIDLSGIGGRSP